MRIGVLLLPTDPWPETLQLVQQLDGAGFDHLWVYDHLTWRRYRDRPWFSAVPWLTGVAGVTDRIRIGTLVANPNIRHPLTLAKEMMTLDHISGGRLTVGIGAGGTGFDATVLGADRLSPGQRVARMREFVELFDGLLTGSIRTHRGNYYAIEDATVLPRCVQRPRLPIAIAAGQSRTLRIAAEYGDAWVTWGDTTLQDLTPRGTFDVVQRQLDYLRQECIAMGRPFGEIDRIFLAGNTESTPLDSIDSFVRFAHTYAEIGFTDLVFHHPRPDDSVWNEDPAIVHQIAAALPRLHEL